MINVTPVELSGASYSTEVEGGKPVVRRFSVAGRLHPASFLDFVAERAAWFGLSGWAAADGHAAVMVVAAGPEALVGALEMAITLGPLDALVDHLVVERGAGDVPHGFELRI